MSIDNVTITSRAQSVLNGLEDEFKALCSLDDFKNKLVALKEAWNGSDRSSKLRELFDLFDMCHINYERGKDYQYYEDLVRDSDIPSFLFVEDRMVYALYSRYKEFPTPENYMKRIVDNLSEDKDWENDTLRLRILKQFIKYGDYLSEVGFSKKTKIGGKDEICNYVKDKIGKKPTDEEVIEHIDDGVFDALEAATVEQRRPSGKYGLQKIADDLAGGKFRVEGSTKKSLYLFAMVYGMTYGSGNRDKGEMPDSKTDIEKNLFNDYYTNNLMRFISEVYREHKAEFDPDPSGQGINYKNFAEMIYLYYICKDCSRQDKIRLSAIMIERIKNRQLSKERINVHKDDKTDFYRGLFRSDNTQDLFSEDILSLDEASFEEFICENYDCNTYAGSHKSNKNEKEDDIIDQKGVFQLRNEQESAYAQYTEIINSLTKRKKLEHCNYGLWFTDVAAFRKKGMENICDRNPNIDRDEFEVFMELLLGMNNFIGRTVQEMESTADDKHQHNKLSKAKTKALYVTSAEKVTRTSIIVAYYYYYNAVHEKNRPGRWKSFKDVFEDFRKGIDPILEKAYYQPLSGRNIFDVLVTFSSYAYLNF